MNMKIWLQAISLFFATGLMLAQTEEKKPSLAELARKAREQKALSDKEIRVITNADLKRMEGARVSMGKDRPKSGQKTTDPGEDTPSEKPDEDEIDLAFWTSAFNEARLDLKNAVSNALVLELRMNNLRNAFFAEEDASTRSLIDQQLQEGLEAMERNKQEIEEARKKLEKIQKEAQEAGVAPGLIRELTGEIPEAQSILSPATPNP